MCLFFANFKGEYFAEISEEKLSFCQFNKIESIYESLHKKV